MRKVITPALMLLVIGWLFVGTAGCASSLGAPTVQGAVV